MLQRVSFMVAGEAQYDRAFRVLESESENMLPAFEETAKVLVDVTGQQFETEGAHGLGTPWQQLSHPYAEQKEARYGFRPILVASGKLREAILTNGTIEIGPRRLVWGVPPDAVYPDGTRVETVAAAHQSGEGNLPQRKIIALSTGDRRRIDRVFVEYFAHIRRTAGFLNRPAAA